MSETYEPKSKHIPQATIKRLSTYLQVLKNLDRDKVEVVSSNPLAEACGVQGSQVRKDLAYFGEFGIRGVGYQVKSLMQSITSSLGIDHEWPMLLIGVGNLGRAMINHVSRHASAFSIKAIFDCDPFKIGDSVYGYEVLSPSEIPQCVEKMHIDIGIITSRPERAQTACDHLVHAGITAILNFAPVRLKVPDSVRVEYVDFFRNLYSLVFNLSQGGKS